MGKENLRDCQSCGEKGTVYAMVHKDDNGTHSYIKCSKCNVTTLTNLDLSEFATPAKIDLGRVNNMSIGVNGASILTDEANFFELSTAPIPGAKSVLEQAKLQILEQLAEDLDGEDIPDIVKEKLGMIHFELKHNTEPTRYKTLEKSKDFSSWSDSWRYE